MKNFWYLFAAYSIIWTALCVHDSSITENKELQVELHNLQAQLERILTK